MIRSTLLAAGLFAHLSGAETLLVPEQYPTIQEAANASSDGDVIEVNESHLEFGTLYVCKSIVVQCSSNVKKPTIDAGGVGAVIEFCSNNENIVAEFVNLNLINGTTQTTNDGNGRGGCLILGEGDTGRFIDCSITNCSVNGGSGGAFNVTNGRSVYLSSCTITSCSALGTSGSSGGAAFCGSLSSGSGSGSFIAEETVFSDCIAVWYGGAVCVAGYGNIQLNLCTIDGCNATYGGGLYRTNPGSSLEVNDSVISNCYADDGGGLYSSGETALSQVTFRNCQASNAGGGARFSNDSSTISGIRFEGNSAAIAGGLLTDAVVAGCEFISNTATSNCGGLSGGGSVTGSFFCGNIPNPICDVEDDGFNTFEASCDIVGNCCLGGGCLPATENDCLSTGGTFTQSDCNECPDENGSCCIAGSCSQLSVQSCFELGGSFAGFGISCTNIECPTDCEGDVSGNGTVDFTDLLILISNWGNCPG